MSLLDDILAHNREYVEDQNTGYVDTDTKCSKMPSREMAIVTCMDTRLTPQHISGTTNGVKSYETHSA